MDSEKIQELVDRYIKVSHYVMKRGESLIRNQISEDLTNDQHATLRYIKKTNNCTSSELADVFDVKKSAITAIINRLTDKELIIRTRDESDRRVVYLTLTNLGEELFQKSEQKINHLVGHFITQFNQDEIEQFINTYEKLATILEEINIEHLEDEQ
ncbi:MarR family winged helix-turn-helix transcriptional regulator [Litchfieldia alkalitelluris]|uniref:MarR family winged helix-turn-helix transcriptional regulator n=1 Tax=Litchfieldia alkalitelluris TaxID=304268 RepID=UPI000998220F|nr:MarR family transcriptional regulator [Litchfieldia alkalitelluris]